jgi:phosphatidylinositol-3-phosphatase
MTIVTRNDLKLVFAFAAFGVLALVGATGAAGSSSFSGACGGRHGHQPRVYKHVITIVMENHPFSAINGASPYLNSLSRACGLAANYQAITHPSLPNYIAMTSGDTQGINDDCDDCSTDAASIFEQLGPSGWRSYLETMPSPGFTGADSGSYTKHHNPAAYYTKISSALQANAVPLGSPSSGALASDLRANRLPRYALIVPNKCNDEHDCSVETGDSWLRRWVTRIIASPVYSRGGTAIFITYDEGSDEDNHVYTAVVSPYTSAGTKSSRRFDHYSLLKTQESMLGLPCLGRACSAASMRSAFGL